MNWSSAQFVLVQAAATVPAGQSWLQAVTSSSAANSSNPAVMTVAVNTSGLTAGVYTGTIDLTTIGGVAIGSVNVTLILGSNTGSPPTATAHPLASRPDAVGLVCTPAVLSLTETSIPNNFSVPAGWPSNLVATMTDNCGTWSRAERSPRASPMAILPCRWTIKARGGNTSRLGNLRIGPTPRRRSC